MDHGDFQAPQVGFKARAKIRFRDAVHVDFRTSLVQLLERLIRHSAATSDEKMAKRQVPDETQIAISAFPLVSENDQFDLRSGDI